MPGFDPVSLALGGISAIPQLYAAYQQNKKADALTLQDTTTAGEREQLAMSRQAAATARMPGQGAAEARLGQMQAGAVQNAQLGSASSSDFLASAGAADTRRMQGEQQLATQGQQFQQQSQQQLRRDLTTQSQRQQRDLDTFNTNKAALLQGSATNLNNAVQTGASYTAQAYNMGMGNNMDAAGNTGQVADMGYDPINYRTSNLGGGMGAYGGPPSTLPNLAGHYPGIRSLGSRRFSNMDINFGKPQ